MNNNNNNNNSKYQKLGRTNTNRETLIFHFYDKHHNLLRKITTAGNFSPDKDWAKEIEPRSTYYTGIT